ncbi:MAG: DUF5110 domain-containing protein [Bacteroidales bacterium]|nr:DUF5110 domain-containing protein [Bacteroidales bacterium]
MNNNSIKLFLVLLIICNSFFVTGQNAARKFVDFQQKSDTIMIIVSDGEYWIIPFNEKIMKVSFYPSVREVKNFSFAVDVLPVAHDISIIETEKSIEINYVDFKTVVVKNPFQILHYFHNDLLLSEKTGYVNTDSTQLIDFNLEPDEKLYGGGTRVLGMNRRGNKLELYNRAHYGYETHSELMNYTLPVYISSKKYTVLFDNASKGFLDLDSQQTNTLVYETVSGTMNYYVIVADDWFDLVKQYTWLTGRQPLPPAWAFGNFSSRFGYHSQKEVLSTADKFFENEIPVEALIIDIYWFGQEIFGAMGNLDWYRDSFPSPETMIDELNEKNIKTILVTEPFILTTSDKWDEAVEADILCKNDKGEPYTYDFYFGNTGLIDIYKPEAVEWFWDFYKDFTNQGIGGWWGDLGEPEVHPSDLQHVIGSADEVHNAYGHEWLKMIWDGYQRDFPDVRPFILMRSGYAGSQRHGIIPWTGDVNRSWGGLVPQVELSLQMGMQGIAYMHSDLGGFAGGDTLDNELYIRWLQYGVFQPIYRPHAQEHIPAEPVFMNDTTKAHVKAAIELRYRMFPYNYSLAFENNQTGRPLMTPLFFIEPDNDKLLEYDAAYLWGDNLLVSPVKEAGKKMQKVYFPSGSDWIDFYTGTIFKGGEEANIKLTIDHIPVFVKAGAFIPMLDKPVQISRIDMNAFDMHYYMDESAGESRYALYSDDGVTQNSFEKGDYQIMNFTASPTGESLNISMFSAESYYSSVSKPMKIRMLIHNLGKLPQKVKYDGKVLQSESYMYDAEIKTLSFSIDFTNGTKLIELVY